MTAASSEVSNHSVRLEVLVCTRRMTQNSVDGSDWADTPADLSLDLPSGYFGRFCRALVQFY